MLKLLNSNMQPDELLWEFYGPGTCKELIPLELLRIITSQNFFFFN